MVKPQFSNLKVDLWVHHGRIGVAQHNLCLFHDSVERGSPILDALNELRHETRPAQRTLTFAGCSRKRALTNMRLIVDIEREELRVMNIRHDTDNATIEMTDDGLTLLIDACTGVAWRRRGFWCFATAVSPQVEGTWYTGSRIRRAVVLGSGI